MKPWPVLLGCSLFVSALASGDNVPNLLPTRFERPEVLAPIQAPTGLEWQRLNWLRTTGEMVWALDPDRRRVVTFRWRRAMVSQESSADTERQGERSTVKFVQQTSLLQTASWPLPEELLKADQFQALTVIPISFNRSWLVDSDVGRVWRLENKKWSGPWLLGESVHSAATLPDGRLALGTPEAAKHAFVILNPSGEVGIRFGERIAGPRHSLEKVLNRWVLTTASDGELVALHRYLPLMRRYGAGGSLKWERELFVPKMSSLEMAWRRIRGRFEVDSETGCVACEFTNYAVAATLTQDGEIAVNFSGRAAIDLYTAQGGYKQSMAVDTADGSYVWLQAGFLLEHDLLISLEPQGVVVRRPTETGSFLTGLVLSGSDGTPVGNASVRLDLGYGVPLTSTTEPDGSFVFVERVPADATGRVLVSASGFQEARLEGALIELISQPVRLRRASLVCVEVLDAETKTPVSSYRLELIREQVSAEAVIRHSGPSREIEEAIGARCVEAPWPAPWSVRLTSEGYATRELRLFEERADPVLVTLEREARVKLTVADSAGDPVGETEVRARAVTEGGSTIQRSAEDSGAEHTAQTTESGLATLAGLSPGRYEIEIEHPDFLPWREEMDLTRGANQVSATLRSGGTMGIQVTADKGGFPVEGAKVVVDPQTQPDAGNATCLTNSSGFCSVTPVRPGSYVVFVRAERFSGGRRRVAVQPGQDELLVEVSLRRGVEIVGFVEGVGEYPETSFEVLVSVPGLPLAAQPVDQQGRFRIVEAPSGSASVFLMERGGAASVFAQKEVEIPQEGPFNLTLRLPPPVEIWGEVSVADGRPCGACWLSFVRQGADVGTTTVTREADTDGRYTARLPATGLYHVEVHDTTNGTVLRDYLTVEGSQVANWRFEGASLAGEVYSEHGEPVSGAQVQLRDTAHRDLGTTVAGRGGDFSFRNLTQGSYTVTATDGKSTGDELVQIVGNTKQARVRVFLELGDGLRVRLRDEASHEPIGAASALILGSDGTRISVRSERADLEGWIRLPSVDAAPLTLVLQAPGHAVLTVRGLQSGQEIDLTVPRPRSFSVEVAEDLEPCAFLVRDSSGLPSALSIGAPPGPVPLTVRAAMFNALPPGSYSFSLRTCSGDLLTQTASLQSGSIPVLRYGDRSP